MADYLDEYKTMVNDCQSRDKKMSEWEKEFMSSIEARLNKGDELTLKQIETLNKIWEKVT